MALVLVLCQLSSHRANCTITEHFFEQTVLADLLGIPPNRINENRLSRALDKALPYKLGA